MRIHNLDRHFLKDKNFYVAAKRGKTNNNNSYDDDNYANTKNLLIPPIYFITFGNAHHLQKL